MLAPRNRLLLLVAVVALPCALLAAAEPAAGAFSAAAMAALAALAVADAVTARRALAGIGVELPEVSRMSREREAKLELKIRNERQHARQLRIGLPLPREIDSDQEDTWVALPGGSEWSRFDWLCRPRERGVYRLASVQVEVGSRLGFWGARASLPVRSEIRVYPNLFSERRELAALFLHRGSFGLHAQRQVGKGREFEQLRDYVPGDGYDEIHWKATAKRGRPVTKVFQIERTQEVYVVIDASRLSARSVANAKAKIAGRDDSCAGIKPTTTLERYITSALVLGLAAEQQGDLFGLLAFTDKVEHFIRAKNGKMHYSACRDALYAMQPRVVTPDFDEVCSFIRLRLRRRALLLFLTALDDSVLAESFVRNMDLIRRQHLVLVNMLQPPNVAPLFSSPDLESVDELYGHLGGHLLWQNLRELEKVLQHRGVRFSLLKNELLSAELVSQYLNIKKRQLL